ncbi:MAG: LysR family transcriptional regulator [Polyangiaceae bacterium]
MDLNHLRVFRAVAETHSFSGAAALLGIDRTRASRVIGALESELGVRLFARTTRSVRPTPEGERLARKITAPLAELEGAVSALPLERQIPTGEVKVTTTADIGRSLIAPALARFRLRYPTLRVQLALSDALVKLPGVDLALRVGRPGTQSWVARRLRRLEAGFFASPSYLERRGVPEAARDLAEHDGLWPVSRGRRSFSPNTRPPPAAVACNDFEALAALACAGGGVAMLPTFVAERHVTMGALVRVLPALKIPTAPLYLMSQPPGKLPMRVLALRDFLIAELQD